MAKPRNLPLSCRDFSFLNRLNSKASAHQENSVPAINVQLHLSFQRREKFFFVAYPVSRQSFLTCVFKCGNAESVKIHSIIKCFATETTETQCEPQQRSAGLLAGNWWPTREVNKPRDLHLLTAKITVYSMGKITVACKGNLDNFHRHMENFALAT